MSDGMGSTSSRKYKKSVQAGYMYRHFKGAKYVVLAVAKDHEIQDYSESKVIYMSMDTGEVYHRPPLDFLALVDKDGKLVDRFTRISDNTVININKGGLGEYDVTSRFY